MRTPAFRRDDAAAQLAHDSIPTVDIGPRLRARGTRPQPAQTGAASEEFGPYLVYEKLGSGGMASVHRAEAHGIEGFRKSIALKRLWPHLVDDREFVESFIQEARLASKLSHDNIAQAYDLGRIDDTYYIAMEYVPGPTLMQIMRHCNAAAGAIPLAIAIEILIQICEALDYAHNLRDDSGRPLGIIHRDVSPTNVIVSSSGIVKLIDFGIAKAASSHIHTEAGIIKGKLAYVAPEYTVGHLDHRADLFGLGVIAHEILTGQRLFLGESDFGTLLNIRSKAIAPPSRINPQVPRDLDAIVLTALQRDPDQRWQNAAAMRNALLGVVRDYGIAVSGQQIRDWVVWAFSQDKRRETQIVNVLQQLEPSMTLTLGDCRILAAAPKRAKPTDPTVLRDPAVSRKKRHSTQLVAVAQKTARRQVVSPWLVMLLLFTVAAAAAVKGWLPFDDARELWASL